MLTLDSFHHCLYAFEIQVYRESLISALVRANHLPELWQQVEVQLIGEIGAEPVEAVCLDCVSRCTSISTDGCIEAKITTEKEIRLNHGPN